MNLAKEFAESDHAHAIRELMCVYGDVQHKYLDNTCDEIPEFCDALDDIGVIICGAVYKICHDFDKRIGKVSYELKATTGGAIYRQKENNR